MSIRINFNNDYNKCFVCGKDNERGLKLDFFYDKDTGLTRTKVTFQDYMQGYDGIIHGGFISMLLDEIMAKSCLYSGYIAITGRLNVKFKKPVYPGEIISFFGRIDEIKGKAIRASAWCEDENALKKAEAESTFIVLSKRCN